MRITTFLLLVCVFCSFAENTHSQNARVSISKRNAQLDEVLGEIEKQTDYLFIYNNQVDVNRKVSVKVKNEPVSAVLKNILKNSEIDFDMEGTHIVLTKVTGKTDAEIQQQARKIDGTILDSNGEPVIGANVIIKGTTNGTVTDIDGKFLLSASKGDIISVSFIGYKMQELPATSDMNIILAEDSQMLENVVVIGYGTVKKNDATGSVIAIKPDEKNRGLQVSPQDMLMGKVAGVSVASSTGQPGSSSSIRIRGGSSLSAKNDPLVVIDGVIMGNSAPDGLSNPLSTINPSDIESFTVLKDASATAIYGSRASNGVIIITTKKGKSGSVKINYSGNVSVSTKRNKVDVMSGDEYRDYITNAPNTTEGMLNALNLFPNVSTDWQDEVLRTAISTDHNISAYGSVKEFMPYRVSFGYTDQNGILKTSNFQRYTGSVSLTPSFFQDHLNVNLNGKGVYIKNRFADTGALGSAVSFDPTGNKRQ